MFINNKFAPVGALKVGVDDYVREHKYNDKTFGIKTEKKLIILTKGDGEDVPILNTPILEDDTVIVDLRMYTTQDDSERNILKRINPKSAGSYKLKSAILLANDYDSTLAKHDVAIKTFLLVKRISSALSLDEYDINILTNALTLAMLNDNFPDLEVGSKVSMYETLVMDNVLSFTEAGDLLENADGIENIQTILSELDASMRLSKIDFSFIDEISKGMTFSLLYQDISLGLVDYRIFLPLVELSYNNVLYKKSWIGNNLSNGQGKKIIEEIIDVLDSTYARANLR